MTVEYRPVVGFRAYRVGDDGSVWSLWKRVGLGRGNGAVMVVSDRWVQLKPQEYGYSGHVHVTLVDEGGRRAKVGVHALVLTAFVGPCPEGMECLHGDGDPTNNAKTNLRWGTHVENAADMIHHGRHHRAERSLDATGVAEAKRLRADGMSWPKIGRSLGVCGETARSAVRGVAAYRAEAVLC